MQIEPIIEHLDAGKDLSKDQMRDAISWLLSGIADEHSMMLLLTKLANKGETATELTGAAEALRSSMYRIHTQRSPIVDTCGTGGDGSKTFNISTAAALVIASTGTAVAKHGNRKITSSTGSADVLAELGINLAAPPEVAQTCLEQIGICFCFAPFFHPAMKNVGPVRQAIKTPTIFNRLGPLANPASANCQVLGVGDGKLQSVMAEALQMLGTRHSIVVRGEDGVDEISISAPTRVLEVTPDAITEHEWTPELFGLYRADRTELFADDPASSAACIREVLEGRRGPKRDVVVLNAAAGLWLAGVSTELQTCARVAEQAIDSGQTQKLATDLGQLTHQ